jgi:colanic acid biosynthesis glycosyl transferase WcaI
MKITFICAVFPPEPAPSAVMARQLASRLVQAGHTVTMVVPFPNRPEGKVYPGFRRRLLSRTVSEEGYAVVRCASWLIGARRRSVDRILENITFGLSSMWAALCEGRPDLLLVETWPLFAMSFSSLLALAWKVPVFYYVKDVYPEAAEESGMINAGGWLSGALRHWDRMICRHSERVITISEAMRDLLVANRKLSADYFAVLPDWVDERAFPTWEGPKTWRASQDIAEDAFVAMFAGTLGHVSGADVLIDVAECLKTEHGVLLLAIGEGIRKPFMVEEAARRNLDNIRMLPFQPQERVPEVQASCDAALLTMQPGTSNASVPSKLITYLAAGRPVICAAKSDSAVARTVLEARAGLVVPPGNGRAIADAILSLRSDPSAAITMGRNGRQYFEKHFTLDRAFETFSIILHGAQTAPPIDVNTSPGWSNQ